MGTHETAICGNKTNYELSRSTKVGPSQTESYNRPAMKATFTKLTSIDFNTGLKRETATWDDIIGGQHNLSEVPAYLKPLSEPSVVIR